MADARLEPPRGVQCERGILVRKPSRLTEITGMDEGPRSKGCCDLRFLAGSISRPSLTPRFGAASVGYLGFHAGIWPRA